MKALTLTCSTNLTAMKEITHEELIGSMYQEWEGLMDVVLPQTASDLLLLSKNGYREVSQEEAEELGYNEIAHWSNPSTDVLILVADMYMICLPR